MAFSKSSWMRQLVRCCFSQARPPLYPHRERAWLEVEALETRLTPSSYVVKNTNYSGPDSLSAAIAAAISNNDAEATITFSGVAGNSTIFLSSGAVSSVALYGPTAYVITGGANITIDGSEAPGLVIDGGNALRLFAVEAGGTLTVENLTLKDGLARGSNGAGGHGAGGGGGGLGGAVFVDGGNFTARACLFINNTASGGNGGAFELGNAGGGGGGLGSAASGSNGGGTNGGAGGSAQNGGAGGAGGFGGGGGGGFAPNEANEFSTLGGGGGFGGGGGGSMVGGPGGFAGGGGGGTDYGIGGFAGGDAGSGGGGSGAGGGGGGAGLGGAILNNQGTLNLVNDTLTGNTAGGGTGSGQLAQNGQGLGGAVFTRNGTLNATFDTFSGNSADGGTDVYVLGDADDGGNSTSPAIGEAAATLVDCILGQADNSVTDLVANVNGDGASFPDLSGSSADLVRDNSGLPAAAVISSADPLLSGLGFWGADNAGPTQSLAPLPGSPALGQGAAAPDPATGSAIASDQRGLSRPGDHPDLGAFQSGGFALATVTGSTPQSTPVDSPFANVLAVTVTANRTGEPVGGGIVAYAPSPAGNGASAALSSKGVATIDSNGHAGVSATANGRAGSYSVSVATGGATTTTFHLSNLPRFVATPLPGTVIAGVAFSVKLLAEDDFGIVTGFTGSVTITSTDPLARRLGTFKFTSNIQGSLAIRGLILKRSGIQTLTFNAGGATSSASATVFVHPGPMVHIFPFGRGLYVEGLDAFGNVILRRRSRV